MEERTTMQVFNDPLYGPIEMHPLLVTIIDTPEFQRLRNIKQLGGGYFVFPGAYHNCFEHSISVAHLAGQLVKSLKAHHGLNIITEQEELCVQIAGLCRDLGHGPFSHAFEEFMKKVKPKWKHEEQSVKMFKDLIGKHNIKEKMVNEGLEEKHLKLIEALINPSNKDIQQDEPYLQQIVANPRTGIDVDKMDCLIRDCHYLGMKYNFSPERYMKFARVCTNEKGEKQICMLDKEASNIYELFHIHNLLHHKAYQHRDKKAAELMIVDALKAAEETFQISAQVEDLQEYMTLTDDILQRIIHHQDNMDSTDSNPEDILKRIFQPGIQGVIGRFLQNNQPKEDTTDSKLKTAEKAQKIIRRIFKRDFYKFVGGKILEPENVRQLENAESQREMLREWLDQIMEYKPLPLNADDFEVVLIKFNYGMKRKNPNDVLRFYKEDNPDQPIQLPEDEVSYLLPQKLEETKGMLFYKGDDVFVEELAKEYIEVFWTNMMEDSKAKWLSEIFPFARNQHELKDFMVKNSFL
ncbi:deoxynucleoside triphosphate triphosphohydrolase SAMHD1-like [Colossoma macropomum]|uniref:deoxynucleoside triphosphate triphosphohydrolase SAMHD1-like n=1 Tax=Colossoma macropomum TaxID=42526 RepID=UPI001863D422|nr:deoxynucleoside triphosphate triphosphohydrolase SAMHD1-like [Colossoma macropomum]